MTSGIVSDVPHTQSSMSARVSCAAQMARSFQTLSRVRKIGHSVHLCIKTQL